MKRNSIVQPNSQRFLSLKNLNTTTLPVSLIEFENIEILDISGNDFKELPKQILGLRKLKHIKISENYNMNWSQCFYLLSQLPNLEKVDISKNKLNAIPAEIFHLTNLKTLILDFNPIDGLSDATFYNLPESILYLSIKGCRVNKVSTILGKFIKLKEIRLSNYDWNFLLDVNYLCPKTQVVLA